MRLSIACALAASIVSAQGARAQDAIADFFRRYINTIIKRNPAAVPKPAQAVPA